MWLVKNMAANELGPFSAFCSEYAQTMLSQSQSRLLKYPALWLAEQEGENGPWARKQPNWTKQLQNLYLYHNLFLWMNHIKFCRHVG